MRFIAVLAIILVAFPALGREHDAKLAHVNPGMIRIDMCEYPEYYQLHVKECLDKMINDIIEERYRNIIDFGLRWNFEGRQK